MLRVSTTSHAYTRPLKVRTHRALYRDVDEHRHEGDLEKVRAPAARLAREVQEVAMAASISKPPPTLIVASAPAASNVTTPHHHGRVLADLEERPCTAQAVDLKVGTDSGLRRRHGYRGNVSVALG